LILESSCFICVGDFVLFVSILNFGAQKVSIGLGLVSETYLLLGCLIQNENQPTGKWTLGGLAR